MNSLKKLANDTAIYGLGSIIGRVFNYLLVPFYTSLLLPAEYGLMTELYAYAAFLNVIYGYGMETAYFRFAAQGHPIEIFRLASSSLIVTSVLFSSLLASVAPLLSYWLGYSGHASYIYYLAAILAVDTILLIPFAELRFSNRAFLFAQAKCLQVGLNIAFNFFLLYILPGIYTDKFFHSYKPFIRLIYDPANHIEYIFLANVVSNVCVLPMLSKSLLSFRFWIDWQKLKSIVMYAFPLLIMGLAGITNEMLSRALLKHLLPAEHYPGYSKEAIVGIFGACYKLAILMSLGIQAFRYAAEPFFFLHAKDKRSPQLFSKIMHGYILIACFIWFAISANLDVLGYIFLRNPVYRTSIEIVPYLCLAYVWLGIYYNLSVWFKLADKTYYGSIITLVGAGITVLLNILLVPHWGYWGSVWASVSSYLMMCIICYYKGQKYYPIPYRTGYGLVYILATLVLIILARQICYASLTDALLSNMCFTLIFGLITYRSIKKSFR
jgi:O-antigen/teichoic acid export membrane protein